MTSFKLTGKYVAVDDDRRGALWLGTVCLHEDGVILVEIPHCTDPQAPPLCKLFSLHNPDLDIEVFESREAYNTFRGQAGKKKLYTLHKGGRA
jgi:hypothetical protein